ncbi:hypothetical protein FHS18_003292 [Paenibacillus phyllosphaerae]|uniref:DUF1836 domain-containing protein n=1 Tax=Paenibacillus phyllosphaerae TaxID=274593 RepID=A0A7W5FNP4_9BACL|nr:DUF1836 domain-containing protein [Paenibacillus phyllosphaerae]MBB3111224.1 hypothetical protein [Paenibacillus phyllosphaerae]
METLTFRRKDMADLLLSLNGQLGKSPLAILQDIWRIQHERDLEQGKSMTAFLGTTLPSLFEKMIKSAIKPAFSLSDIVALGAQVEFTHFSVTSIQNWVKRDFKELIGQPEDGKKYSLQQVALFFIIEDLRSALDYDSIRKMLTIVFGSTIGELKQGVTPLDFYSAYAELYEVLDERYKNYSGTRQDFITKWDQMLDEAAHEFAIRRCPATGREGQEVLKNAIHVSIIAVHTASFNSLARRYVNGMVFLHDFK